MFALCPKHTSSSKEYYRIFFFTNLLLRPKEFHPNFPGLFLSTVSYRFQSRLSLFVRFIYYVTHLLYLNYSLLKFMNTRCNDLIRSDSRGCRKNSFRSISGPFQKDIKRLLLKLQSQMLADVNATKCYLKCLSEVRVKKAIF
jgi:hypothetical protein